MKISQNFPNETRCVCAWKCPEVFPRFMKFPFYRNSIMSWSTYAVRMFNFSSFNRRKKLSRCRRVFDFFLEMCKLNSPTFMSDNFVDKRAELRIHFISSSARRRKSEACHPHVFRRRHSAETNRGDFPREKIHHRLRGGISFLNLRRREAIIQISASRISLIANEARDASVNRAEMYSN